MPLTFTNYEYAKMLSMYGFGGGNCGSSTGIFQEKFCERLQP
jgi:hypothetical protein